MGHRNGNEESMCGTFQDLQDPILQLPNSKDRPEATWLLLMGRIPLSNPIMKTHQWVNSSTKCIRKLIYPQNIPFIHKKVISLMNSGIKISQVSSLQCLPNQVCGCCNPLPIGMDAPTHVDLTWQQVPFEYHLYL